MLSSGVQGPGKSLLHMLRFVLLFHYLIDRLAAVELVEIHDHFEMNLYFDLQKVCEIWVVGRRFVVPAIPIFSFLADAATIVVMGLVQSLEAMGLV